MDLQVYLAGDPSSAIAPVLNGSTELMAPAPGIDEVRIQYTRQLGSVTRRDHLPLHPIVRVEIGANAFQHLPVLRIDAAQFRAALEAR